MDFNGIPLHPLVVHAAVVTTPLAGLFAILYGVVPRWRWAIRWPFLVVALAGAIATYLASATGDDLKDRLKLESSSAPATIRDLLDKHEMWAGRLQFGMWVLAALAIIAVFALPYRSQLKDGKDQVGRVAVLSVPLAIVLPLVGIAVLAFVYFTGDAGAQMVWNGTPK